MGLCVGKKSKPQESEEGQSQHRPDKKIKKMKAKLQALENKAKALKERIEEMETQFAKHPDKLHDGGDQVDEPVDKVADERHLEYLETPNEHTDKYEKTQTLKRSSSPQPKAEKRTDKIKSDRRSAQHQVRDENIVESSYQSNQLHDDVDLADEPVVKVADKSLFECLVAHNQFRVRHENTKPMKWSASLASEAQKRADKIKSDGIPEFQVDGENIGACSGSETRPERTVTEQWYSEMQNFNFDNKCFSLDTGRFTQVVWKASTEMGAGKVVLHNGKQLLVVRYSPAGNITGEYDKNVGNLIDGTTLQKDLGQDSDSESESDDFGAGIPGHLPDFQRDVLRYHNKYRAKHADTPTMVWSVSLAKEAQGWATEISHKGKMAHCPSSEREGQGENICKGTKMTGKKATGIWYDEIKDFDFANKLLSGDTKCFSQVVWKESIEIGAGLALSDQGEDFCVVRYRAAGNARSSFAQNIGDRLAIPQKKADMDHLRIQMEQKKAADAEAKSNAALQEMGGLASTSATAEGDIQLPADSMVRTPVQRNSSSVSLGGEHNGHLGTTNPAFQLKESPKKKRIPSSLSSTDDGNGDGTLSGAPVMYVPSSSSYDDGKQICAQVNKVNNASSGGIANLGLEADSAGNLHVETTPGVDLHMETTPDAAVNFSTYDGPDRGDLLGELETVADYPTEPVVTIKPPDTFTQEEGIANLRYDIVDAHNEKRELHEDTPLIEWDEHLAEEAQKWADKIAEDGKMSHCLGSDREGQGENLAMCKGKVMTGRIATENWYRETKDFDFNNKVFHSKTGHFTQVVWKGSTKIGAAISQSEDGQIFCVARYSPGGNMKGDFEENIGNLL